MLNPIKCGWCEEEHPADNIIIGDDNEDVCTECYSAMTVAEMATTADRIHIY